MKTLENLNRRF